MEPSTRTDDDRSQVPDDANGCKVAEEAVSGSKCRNRSPFRSLAEDGKDEKGTSLSYLLLVTSIVMHLLHLVTSSDAPR